MSEDDSDGHDRPQWQLMKVMNVLDCAPGFRGQEHTPIAILTAEVATEIVVLMLGMREVRRLVVDLVNVLDQHEETVPVSRYDIDQAKAVPPAVAAPTKPPVSAPHSTEQAATDRPRADQRLSCLPSTGIVLQVRFDQPRTIPWQLALLGGYESNSTQMLLCRHADRHRQPQDYLAKVLPKGRIRIGGTHPESHTLPRKKWKWFGALSAGSGFMLGKRTWRKLSAEDLRQLVANRVFLCVS